MLFFCKTEFLHVVSCTALYLQDHTVTVRYVGYTMSYNTCRYSHFNIIIVRFHLSLFSQNYILFLARCPGMYSIIINWNNASQTMYGNA